MNSNKNKGFTLIELLVVIAIIGILASVVLASLALSREKGDVAKTQKQLRNVISAAELYYVNNNNSYGTAAGCTTAGSMFVDTVTKMDRLATDTNWPGNASNKAICRASGQNYAFMVDYKNNAGTETIYCVDSDKRLYDITTSFGGTINATTIAAAINDYDCQ